MLTALAGLRLRGDQIVLLDEPTNNLDRQAQEAESRIVVWRGRRDRLRGVVDVGAATA